MANFPNKFDDPSYDAADASSAAQVGIDPILLRSVRTSGERSNADQVSSAGATTPYQFTPGTKKLILDKYGLDVTLNPQNASLGAAYLLKEGLDRNKGDAASAVAEYHGGTDPANHGPITKAYVGRVMGGAQDAFLDSLAQGIKADQQAATAQPQEAQPPSSADQSDPLDALALSIKNEPTTAAKVMDVVTGEERKTPETEAAQDWIHLPEYANNYGAPGFKAALGTLVSGPAETAKVIKANFPDVQVRQDEKGNYFIKSAENGQEYAIKPGFQTSDIPRAAGALLAFTPAGRARTIAGSALGSAATQAGIEATQAATGGEFNPGDVAAAGVLGAAVPAAGRAVEAAKTAIAGRGAKAAEEVAQAAPTPAPEAPPVAAVPEPVPVASAAPEPIIPPESVPPTVTAPAMESADLAATAKAAATGTGKQQIRAQQILAEQAAPNPETLAAAKRLGIEDNLQPDHVTTNQAFRELSQAIKSVPGSAARAQELEGLGAVAKRADDIVTELGGTHDLSTLSQNLKNQMVSTGEDLEKRANDLYAQIREAIPADTRVSAPSTLQFIEQRAKDLGGVENLSPLERSIVKKLSPKTKTTTEPVPGQAGVTSATTRQVESEVQPLYGLMDNVRQTVGRAARMQGPFKDADTGLAKKLYQLITDDQEAAIKPFGMTETIDAAKAAVRTRKGLEDDVVSLFGKNLGGSIVGNLAGSTQALGKGDTAKFVKMIQAVPESMRQEVAASALNYAFGKGAKAGTLNFNTFARWYEGLQQNKQAYAALMSNLPAEARRTLKDLYEVSNGISLASKERIMTGRLNAITKELEGADTAMQKVYEVAKGAAKGLGYEVGTSAIGLHGAGLVAGISSALSKAKPEVMKAADKLITSPEFAAMAKASVRGETPKAATVRHFAKTKNVRDFLRSAGKPRDPSNAEQWLMGLFQSANESNQ